MKVVICDDEKQDRQMLREYLERFCREQSVEMEIYEKNGVASPAEMIAFVRKYAVDALFLDIDMPQISGDLVAQELGVECPEVCIIFFTNRDELVYDMIKYKPFRFIRKQCPAEIEDALMALVRRTMLDGEVVLDKGKYEQVCVRASEIRYVEVVRHQLVYHMDDYDVYTRGSMAKCETKLKIFGFIRTHAAYLVNICNIKRIGRKEIELLDGTEIPVGVSYRENMIRGYKTMLERLRYGQPD